ncbi:hypothetical protein HB364_16235 [Pseudoflavitalea sp. X16]|uniref:hypothetical protein n=1 Tax=Paraflavitalea devenefica TaxID=2716334 RepID=UPI001422112D|nr:hypothetical protein [Paraflavitalea devenefica]NII26639.1 hypothetical protein [Paraflavitalea devenefica]
MRFLTFVKQNANQEDPALKSFARFFINTQPPQLSSDPRILAVYLYGRLNPQQTKGFQVFMILYRQEGKNQLAPDLKNDDQAFLEAINRIVYFQQHDPLKRTV